MNNDNIYQIKIDQFINITQESDIEIAKKYLMKYNWNVEDAVSNYLNYQFNNSQLKSNKNSASVRTNNNSSINRQEKKETDSGFFFGMVKNFLNFGGLFDNNQTNFTNIYSNNNNNNSNIIQENPNRNNNNRNIIQENLNRNNNDSNIIQENLNRNNNDSNIIQENLNRNNNNIVVTNDDSSEILKLFDFISSREKNYKNFLNKLKEKPGLIICFNENSLGNLYVLVESIKNEDYLIDMIDHSLSLHLINSASSEFKELSKFFTFNKLPSIIYINKTQLNAITIENVFLIDDNTSIEYFRETIFNQINDPKNNPSAEVIYNEQNINYPIRDSDLINYQNQELKELERQAEEEKRREIKEGFERQKKIEEEKKQVQEKEQTKKLLMSKITKEPDENDPDAYLVAFRSPHNNLRKERRFKKTDKIQVLYDYVKSLSEEFEVQEFSLFKPFLGNLENKEKTLEEEKLSNALLQIKEL